MTHATPQNQVLLIHTISDLVLRDRIDPETGLPVKLHVDYVASLCEDPLNWTAAHLIPLVENTFDQALIERLIQRIKEMFGPPVGIRVNLVRRRPTETRVEWIDRVYASGDMEALELLHNILIDRSRHSQDMTKPGLPAFYEGWLGQVDKWLKSTMTVNKADRVFVDFEED